MVERAAGDFLKKDAQTPLRASYLAAGVDLRIDTNFEPILRIAQQSFDPACSGNREEIRLRLWVDENCLADEPRPKPYFRGLGHLVFAGFDGKSSLLINLRDRYAAGRRCIVRASPGKQAGCCWPGRPVRASPHCLSRWLRSVSIFCLTTERSSATGREEFWHGACRLK